MQENQNRLLVSDSLIDVIEPDDAVISKYDDAFILGALFIKGLGPLVGNISGIALEAAVKIDMRVNIFEAYNIVSKMATGEEVFCDGYQLQFGGDEVNVMKNFRISSPKIMSIDHENRMCVLAVDLIEE